MHPLLWSTKLGANQRRTGDWLVLAVISNDLTHWATRAPSVNRRRTNNTMTKMKRTKWQTMVHITQKLEWALPLKTGISYALHNRKFLFHWWHMLFSKCASDNKHVSITDLLKVLSLFHQHALNRIGGVMVNVFASWSHHLTKNGGVGLAIFYWSANKKWAAMYIGVSILPLSYFI